MVGWLSTLTMLITALAFATTAIVATLTYRQTRKTHALVDGTRQTANNLVSKIAYIQGRQDALITVLKVTPEDVRRTLTAEDS